MNKRFAEFLAADERPEGSMILPELYGFMFAVCCSPELTTPPDWMPVIFNGDDPNFKNDAEAKWAFDTILEVYDDINNSVVEGEVSLPEWLEILEPPMENFGDEAPLAYWSRGFFVGHDWLMEVWQEAMSDEIEEEVGVCLMLLTFFSSTELAENYCSEAMDDDSVTVEMFSETVVDAHHMAMNSYAKVGRSLYLGAHTPYEREDDKVGRNDPCPCGSGKKFKKCCLH